MSVASVLRGHGLSFLFTLLIVFAWSNSAVLARQQSIQCPSGGNLMLSTCTAFGHGADSQIKTLAIMILSSESNEDEFCIRVWDRAESWVNGFLTLVYGDGAVFENGQWVDKDAMSRYNTNGSWIDGFLSADWLRNSNLSTQTRALILRRHAIHEATHNVCDEGDFGSCDTDNDNDVGEDDIENKMTGCGVDES